MGQESRVAGRLKSQLQEQSPPSRTGKGGDDETIENFALEGEILTGELGNG
jgi:hypothetical protein